MNIHIQHTHMYIKHRYIHVQYIHMCIHIQYTHIYIYTNVDRYTNTLAHKHINMYTYRHVQNIHVCILYMYAVHVYIYICIFIQAYINLQILWRTNISTCIHIVMYRTYISVYYICIL